MKEWVQQFAEANPGITAFVCGVFSVFVVWSVAASGMRWPWSPNKDTLEIKKLSAQKLQQLRVNGEILERIEALLQKRGEEHISQSKEHASQNKELAIISTKLNGKR